MHTVILGHQFNGPIPVPYVAYSTGIHSNRQSYMPHPQISPPPPLSFLPHRVFVGGHSAGAHLSACLLAMGGGVRGGGGEVSCTPFAGAVLVSGIYELGPIQQCYVNDPLQLTT